jgi:hypothetical protein
MSKLNDVTFVIRDRNKKTLCIIPGCFLNGVVNSNGTIEDTVAFYKGKPIGELNVTTKYTVSKKDILKNFCVINSNLEEYLNAID